MAGIDAREYLPPAVGVQAQSRIAAGVRPGRRTAVSAKKLRGVPQHQSSRMGGEIGLVGGQYRAQVAQVLKLAQFGVRRLAAAADRDGESRPVAKQSKVYLVVFVEKALDLVAFEQHELQRIAADEAVIVPDRDEARVRVPQRFVQPVRVLAAFAAAIDERPCEHIAVFHR